jgi:hypothetical protein
MQPPGVGFEVDPGQLMAAAAPIHDLAAELDGQARTVPDQLDHSAGAAGQAGLADEMRAAAAALEVTLRTAASTVDAVGTDLTTAAHNYHAADASSTVTSP